MFDGKRLLREVDGATAVEYALLLALIAAVIVGTVAAVGEKMPAMFDVQF